MKSLNNFTLPTSWASVQISEVAITTSGGTPSRGQAAYFGGGIPWVKSGELRDNVINLIEESITELGLQNSSAKIFPANTTVVALYGATVGRTGILGKSAATNQAVCAIFPRLNSFEARYAFYWLQSKREDLIGLSAGGAQRNISQGIIQDLQFPLAPLNEQHRIVEAIETHFTRLDAAVAALKRAQTNLKRYRSAVLKAACEGNLVPTETALAQAEGRSYEPAATLLERILAERRRKWEAENPGKKYKEPAAPDTSELPELPEGWCWGTVEQLSSAEKYALAIGPFGSNLVVSDYRDSGVPLVFVRNIRSNTFDNGKYVTYDKALELIAHKISSNDILITKMGDPPGDACLYPSTRPEAIITADCIKWRLSEILISKLFFVHAVHSTIIHRQIINKTRGVAQKKVSLERFKEIASPLPPLAEQQRIVAEVERRLSLIDQLEKSISADLARAERLR